MCDVTNKWGRDEEWFTFFMKRVVADEVLALAQGRSALIPLTCLIAGRWRTYLVRLSVG